MEHYYAERVETLVEWGVSQRTLDQLINLGLQSFVWAGSKLDGSKPRRLHLISRLPHQVDADDQWLTALRASVDEAGSRGEHILAGVDLTGWSYTAWYAARFDLNIWIILPPAPLDNFQSTVDNSFRQLNLNPARTVFIQPVFSPPLKKSICLRLAASMSGSMSAIPSGLNRPGVIC